MLKNYLIVASRNLLRHKGYSFINIAGLAIGMTCTILILLWVQDELSFDRFHKNADRIYRVNKTYQMGNETSSNESTPYPLADAAKTGFPEIIDASKCYSSKYLIKYKDKIFNENGVCLADTSFFKIFDFNFVKGSAKTALSDPQSLILTEEMAQKYFGSEDPIGKVLMVNNRDEYSVTGVIQNIPLNSELQYDFFIAIYPLEGPGSEDDWGSHYLSTWVLLRDNTNIPELEKKLSALIQEHLETEQTSLKLQPLRDIHLYTPDGKGAGLKYVYFFSLIAVFILVIGCVNFMSLSTARSSKRAKEVGLRKVVGASKSNLRCQFLGESVLISLIAMVIAFTLVEFLCPAFNDLTGKHLKVSISSYSLFLSLFAIAILAGLFSGVYPALFLSSFQPAKVLKGILGRDKFGSYFRKILVIIQFTLAIVLMIGTGLIYSQLKYIQNKDLGYNKENVVYLSLNDELQKNYGSIKEKLLQNHNILSATRASGLPSETWSIIRGIVWEGKETDEGAAFSFVSADYDYIETLNMEMADGRSFSRNFPTDTANFIFNQKAIELIGYQSPVGKKFGIDELNGTIIGVVKDFNSLPLQYEVEPLMMLMIPDYYRWMLIRTSSHDAVSTIDYIENVWKNAVPHYPFEYHFLDERFDKLYQDEIRAGKLFGYFVVLAILISCLGLLGLSSFAAEQRTKEIGVRKVLGASIWGIVQLLSKEFILLVAISNIVAWPIAYYVMIKWLQSFAYRIGITWHMFVLAALLALATAIITVSFQAVKAATANPVNSLRYE